MSDFNSKLEAFTRGISEDLPHEMLVELKQLELNDDFNTIIKNLKYFCKHYNEVVTNAWIGICFNYSRHFIKNNDYNSDFYDISCLCSSIFTDSAFCIPDSTFISCWEGGNKDYRLRYMRWIIKQLKLAQAL